MGKILEVKGLHVSFTTFGGEVQAVRGVSFDLYKGKRLRLLANPVVGKV